MLIQDATILRNVKIITLTKFEDSRGFFIESYNQDKFKILGVDVEFKQDNHSRSETNVIRGMHFQTFPGQGKLVRCTKGKIWDVAVDMRKSSKTFGRWEAFELSEENNRMVYIPPGFAHGFLVLEGPADVHYRCTKVYDPKTESGFRFDDSEIAIKWPTSNPIVSDRDKAALSFKEVVC